MGLTKAQLEALNVASFPNNNEGLITPQILRDYNSASIANTVNQDTYTTDSASFDSRINALDPSGSVASFSSLNAFTASQLTINTGYNTFTQSADGRLDNLEATTSSLNSSITQLNANTASQQSSINQLNTNSASVNSSISQLNASSASQQTSINNLNSFTASQSSTNSGFTNSINALNTSASLAIVSASVSGPNLTFVKGDTSTFSVTLPSGSGGSTDITALNSFTASQLTINAGYNTTTASLNSSVSQLNANTASQQAQINSLNTTTASLLIETANLELFSASTLTRLTNIETTTASLNSSVSQLNANTASQQSQIDSLISATASYANSASVAAVDAAQQSQINALIASTGSSDNTSLNAFTASQLTINTGYNTFTSSANQRLTAIESVSGSWITESETGSFANITVFNQYTSSNDSKVNQLISATGSYANSASVALVDANQQSQINALIAVTASFLTSSADITSLNQFTASQQLLNSTFATTGSNTFVGQQTIQNNLVIEEAGNPLIYTQITQDSLTNKLQVNQAGASGVNFNVNVSMNELTASLTEGYVWAGGVGNVSKLVATSSFIEDLSQLNAFTASQLNINSGYNSYTASNDTKWNTLAGQSGSWITESETGSFARYDVSNPWSADQTFTNISAVSASFQYVQTIFETASVIYSSGSNQFGDELTDIQTLSGSVKIRGGLLVNDLDITGSINSISAKTGSYATTGSNIFYGDQIISGSNSMTYGLDVTNGIKADYFYTDGQGVFTPTLYGVNVGLGKLQIEALDGVNINGHLTASLQQGYIWVGNASSKSLPIPTSSLSVENALTSSISRNLIVVARNGGASTLAAGTVVHITSAIGDNPVFTTASYDTETLSSNTFGLLRYSSLSGADVEVVVNGVVTGVNTDPALGYVAGDVLYLSSSGQFTKVQPQAPNQIVVIGQVLRAQQNNGSIYVDINNGWELNELHNVQINNAQTGDLLQYESSSYGLWKNKSIQGAGITTTSSFNAYTSSNDQKVNSLISATGSYATTGSNTFYGIETVSGAIAVSGTVKAWGNGNDFEFGTYGTDFLGGAFNLFADKSISTLQMGGNQETNIEIFANGGNYDTFKVKVDSSNNGTLFQDFPAAAAYSTWMSVGTSADLSNLGDVTLHRNTNISGNLDIQSTLTASLQQGYVWVGNNSGKTTTVSTSSFVSSTLTGSFATTGSNNFVGTQFISASNGIALLLTGSIIQSPNYFISSSRVDVQSTIQMGDGSYFRFLSGSSYYNMQLNPSTGDWAFSRNGASNIKTLQLAGSDGANTRFENNPVVFDNTTTQVTFNSPVAFNSGINSNVQVSGSLRVSGSSTFTGNQIISGTFIQSGSNSLAGGPGGAFVGTHIQNRVLISGPSGGETPRLYISGSDGAYSEYGRGFQSLDTRKSPGLGSFIYQVSGLDTSCNSVVSVANDDFSTDVELQMFANTSSIGFADFDNGTTFNYVPFMKVAPNNGNNPPVEFKRSVQVTGSLQVSGSTTITGSTDITGSLRATGDIKFAKGDNKTCDIVNVNTSLTVSNSLVTANSIILVTTQNSQVAGDEYPAVISNKTTGQFTINHNYGGQLQVAYLIINPA